jgi:hypothetical protein
MSHDVVQVANRLNELSQLSFVALPVITDWPESLDITGDWMLSPELVSLYGSDTWHGLDELAQKKLAYHELVNFFSLNIHGERFLLAGLADQLYGRSHNPSYPYIHHFIDEENKHLHYFGTFCTRMAGKIYQDRKLSLPISRKFAPGEADLLFFTRILIFEELVDYFNVKVAKDERVHPLIRRINSLHHQDEVRHLAFGRITVGDILERHRDRWSDETKAGISAYIVQYVNTTLREYCNPDVYTDAGLAEPYEVADQAYWHARPMHRQAARKVIAFLTELGLLDTDPLEANHD